MKVLEQTFRATKRCSVEKLVCEIASERSCLSSINALMGLVISKANVS
jgi:hypothetical protein